MSFQGVCESAISYCAICRYIDQFAAKKQDIDFVLIASWYGCRGVPEWENLRNFGKTTRRDVEFTISWLVVAARGGG